jgi:hypothetical protein
VKVEQKFEACATSSLSLIVLAFIIWFFGIQKRKRASRLHGSSSNATAIRNESSSKYRKPELEGDHGETSFHYPGKPELAVEETRSTNPMSSPISPADAAEKEVVDPSKPVLRIRFPENATTVKAARDREHCAEICGRRTRRSARARAPNGRGNRCA